MIKTIALIKTLVARQMAIENILIKHNFSSKDEIQSITEHYRCRDDIKKLFAEVKDEFSFGQFSNWQLADYLNGKGKNDDGLLAPGTKPKE